MFGDGFSHPQNIEGEVLKPTGAFVDVAVDLIKIAFMGLPYDFMMKFSALAAVTIQVPFLSKALHLPEDFSQNGVIFLVTVQGFFRKGHTLNHRRNRIVFPNIPLSQSAHNTPLAIVSGIKESAFFQIDERLPDRNPTDPEALGDSAFDVAIARFIVSREDFMLEDFGQFFGDRF